MRSIRRFAALACVSGALLVGAASPAQAATTTTQQGAVSANPDNYHFGTYYTLDACRFFGESLVAGGAWRYYNCWWEWRTGEPQGYWYLYMFN